MQHRDHPPGTSGTILSVAFRAVAKVDLAVDVLEAPGSQGRIGSISGDGQQILGTITPPYPPRPQNLGFASPVLSWLSVERAIDAYLTRLKFSPAGPMTAKCALG